MNNIQQQILNGLIVKSFNEKENQAYLDELTKDTIKKLEKELNKKTFFEKILNIFGI